jgi:hypothetical protein
VLEQSQMSSLSSLSNRSGQHLNNTNLNKTNSKAILNQTSKKDLLQMTNTQFNREFIEPNLIEGGSKDNS